MIYIIDHQDSFTWNVVHQFSKFDEVYCSNYFELNQKKLDQSNTIMYYHLVQDLPKITLLHQRFIKNINVKRN